MNQPRDTLLPTQEVSLADLSRHEAQPPEQPLPAKDPTDKPLHDPTRYGDWVRGGRCIDF